MRKINVKLNELFDAKVSVIGPRICALEEEIPLFSELKARAGGGIAAEFSKIIHDLGETKRMLIGIERHLGFVTEAYSGVAVNSREITEWSVNLDPKEINNILSPSGGGSSDSKTLKHVDNALGFAETLFKTMSGSEAGLAGLGVGVLSLLTGADSEKAAKNMKAAKGGVDLVKDIHGLFKKKDNASSLKKSKNIFGKAGSAIGVGASVLQGASVLKDIWDPNASALRKTTNVVAATVLTGASIALRKVPVVGIFASGMVTADTVQTLSGGLEAAWRGDVAGAVNNAITGVGNAAVNGVKAVGEAANRVADAARNGDVLGVIAGSVGVVMEVGKQVVAVVTTAVVAVATTVAAAAVAVGRAVVNFFRRW